MAVKYLCKECQKEHSYNDKICNYCFGPIVKVIEQKPKKQNSFTKEKAIKFLKSQRYKNGFKNKPVYEQYTQLLEFIQKAIPEENQEKLF